MMPGKTVVGTIGALFLCCATQSFAQPASPDPDTPQIVGLFIEACMRYTGDAAELRSWIADHHLPQVAPDQAAQFLSGIAAGQVFGASTTSGRHALVSYNSGACQVIGMSGNASEVQQMLLANLDRQHVTVTPVLERSMANGASTQQMYRAAIGSRRWLLSITTKPHSDAPDQAPEVHLMATIDRPPSNP